MSYILKPDGLRFIFSFKIKLSVVHFQHIIIKNGGGERNRTDDLLLAKQLLYQLSYTPLEKMVGLGRLELPTSRLSSARSNQLSYRPGLILFNF